MNREEIVNYVKQSPLIIGEYWVTAGSGMVLHKVREETRDIDVGCTKLMFAKLLDLGWELSLASDGTRTASCDNIYVPH